jgi:hypothetical protein
MGQLIKVSLLFCNPVYSCSPSLFKGFIMVGWSWCLDSSFQGHSSHCMYLWTKYTNWMFKLFNQVIFSRLGKSHIAYIKVLPKCQTVWRRESIVKYIYTEGKTKLILYCTFCLSVLPWFPLWKLLSTVVRTWNCNKLNYDLLWPGCYESCVGTDMVDEETVDWHMRLFHFSSHCTSSSSGEIPSFYLRINQIVQFEKYAQSRLLHKAFHPSPESLQLVKKRK